MMKAANDIHEQDSERFSPTRPPARTRPRKFDSRTSSSRRTRTITITASIVLGLFLFLAPLAHAKKIRASANPVKEELPIVETDREHWSYRRLFMPEPPKIKATALARNDIDRFILQKLEEHEVSISAEADPHTLIRRLTLDLTGMLPTTEEVLIFIADRGDGSDQARTQRAYEALVDRLLQSPHYGEKQAQHWLDLARFAESDGYEHDKEREEAWRYRDWVIKTLNDDLPHDEFVAMQLAGDELSPTHASIATSFLFAGPDMPDSNFQDERKHLILNDITGTIGTALLGMTIGCAQCHDHPYDPISQADFYRLRAFFDNVPPLKRDKQLGPMMKEQGNTVPIARVCIRGDHQRPGPAVQAAYPRIANPAGLEPFPADLPNSTGRRTALARWITQPTNGLFLRATVNRVWQQHFGRGLCATTNDLGLQSDAPSHPELLDWLAAQLPRQRWSLKALHKLIVMSATYRQSGPLARTDTESFHDYLLSQTDTDNRLLRHFPRRRLCGEEMRDSMLQAAGILNAKFGGPPVYPQLPPEVAASVRKDDAKPAKEPTKDPQEQVRRSIYLFTRRNLRLPMFDLFDRPDALLSCAKRSESITATQALTMFNSEFSAKIASAMAKDLLGTHHDPTLIVAAAAWRCYGEGPSEQELELGEQFLAAQQQQGGTLEEAVTDYCLALVNANRFCFVD